MRAIVRKRGNPVHARHVLLGGCLGIVALLSLMLGSDFLSIYRYPRLLLGLLLVVAAIVIPYLVAFAAGPAILLWGWANIAYVNPIPADDPC